MQSTYRSRKFLSLLAILLVALFAFTACGTDTPEAEVVGDAPGVVDAEVVDPEVAEVEAVDAEADAEVDPEALVEETVDTEGSTETDTMTDSETMTDTDVVTDTEMVEVVTETEVTTDTNVITETLVTTETNVVVGDDAEATAPAEEEATDEGATTEDATGAMGVGGAEGALIRGSDLLNLGFINLDGEVSGDIEDMLIDANTGDILYATIEYGGFLDIGDTEVAVPLRAFAWSPNGELVLNFDEATLQNFPDLGDNWPDLTDPTWDDDLGAFWNDLGFDSGLDYDADNMAGVIWLSNMTGFGINNLGGDVGVIRDVLVNLGNSQVAYAIVGSGVGAALDGGDYVVPFESLNIEDMNQNLMGFDADFDQNWLETAPRYDETLYGGNTVLPNDYANEVNTFWGDAGYDVN